MADFGVYQPQEIKPVDVLGRFEEGRGVGTDIRKGVGKRKVAEVLAEMPDPSQMISEEAGARSGEGWTEQPPGAIPEAGLEGAAPAAAPRKRHLTKQDWADYKARVAKVIGKWGSPEDLKEAIMQIDARKLENFNNLASNAKMALESGNLQAAKEYLEATYGFMADGNQANISIQTDKDGNQFLLASGINEETGEPTSEQMAFIPGTGPQSGSKQIDRMQAMFGGDIYRYMAAQNDNQQAFREAMRHIPELKALEAAARSAESTAKVDEATEESSIKAAAVGVEKDEAETARIKAQTQRIRQLLPLEAEQLAAAIDLDEAQTEKVFSDIVIQEDTQEWVKKTQEELHDWQIIKNEAELKDIASKIKTRADQSDYYSARAMAERADALKAKFGTLMTENEIFTQINNTRDDLEKALDTAAMGGARGEVAADTVLRLMEDLKYLNGRQAMLFGKAIPDGTSRPELVRDIDTDAVDRLIGDK